ncbi:2-amino-4-hydroxy-6-hydroxymethyldihydropteridine diphosphokinase [Glaciihabitans sp. INWT7]|uniref:2-amino-4-hydroxy-6- hydroxymethyldihydropteridine diphosphokinase n=1 Tax=Glaciihabitans sp. INWT7 TaxID=2596912 RepID=UPI0021068641|nr:2-amino-4-hydroxy-6-hydroxymethyldihydropteridine diphosphokinase [Glaciihabitans sp. INWT7]
MLPAVIALGSNLGDREENLRAAVHDIAALEGVHVTAVSGIVQSQAVKPTGTDAEAPAYLNAVMLVQSALHPEALLAELNRIEADHGRVRVERWGDRTLDLDIIDFGGLERDSEDLTLPHPRAWERAFVVVPWLQVDAEASLRGHGRIYALAVADSEDVWGYDAEPLWDRS